MVEHDAYVQLYQARAGQIIAVRSRRPRQDLPDIGFHLLGALGVDGVD